MICALTVGAVAPRALASPLSTSPQEHWIRDEHHCTQLYMDSGTQVQVLKLGWQGLSLPTKDLPSLRRMPSNHFRQKSCCISFCVTDTVRTSLCTPTKKTYFMEETSERQLQKLAAGELRCPAHLAALQRGHGAPSAAFAENWSRTSGPELRSSLESGMHSCHSLPNPRSSVLLTVSSLPQLSSGQTPRDEVWTTKGRVALICPSILVSLSDIYKRLIVTLSLNFKWSAFKSEMPLQIKNWDYHYLLPTAGLV